MTDRKIVPGWCKHLKKRWYMFIINPICSMYGIFTYIWVIFRPNDDKYSVHGAYGNEIIQTCCSRENQSDTPTRNLQKPMVNLKRTGCICLILFHPKLIYTEIHSTNMFQPLTRQHMLSMNKISVHPVKQAFYGP